MNIKPFLHLKTKIQNGDKVTQQIFKLRSLVNTMLKTWWCQKNSKSETIAKHIYLLILKELLAKSIDYNKSIIT